MIFREIWKKNRKMKNTCKIVGKNGEELSTSWAKQLARAALFYPMRDFTCRSKEAIFEIQRRKEKAYTISKWSSNTNCDFTIQEQNVSSCFYMIFVLRGSFDYRFGKLKGKISIHELNMWVLPKDEEVEIHFKKDSYLHVLRFQLKLSLVRYLCKKYPLFLAPVRRVLHTSQLSAVFNEHQLFNKGIWNIFDQLKYALEQENLNAMYFEAKALELLSNIMQKKEKKLKSCKSLKLSDYENQNIEKIQKYLCEHLHEKHSIKELSTKFGMNHNKIYCGFRKRYGCSVKKYLYDYKMKQAHYLLKKQMLPISEVADQLAYSSGSSFCEAFKRYYGVCPKEV